MAATFPRPDQAFLAWNQNFYSVANPIATDLGLTTAQLTSYNTLVTGFQTALAACEPGVRSKQTTAAKRAARLSLQTTARQLVSIVEGQANVSDAQKIELGINVRKPPVPTPVPTTAPEIVVLAVSAFLVSVQLRAAGKLRGKPAFVVGASLFSFVGEAPPTDLSQWKFEGNTGKPKFDVQFSNTLAKGTTVWFTAFWFNGAKLSGPMTTPISTVLQGGGVTMTEAKTA